MIGANGSDVTPVTGVRGDRGPRTAIVVGAGIVGLSAAWFLQRRGVEVTVLDRDGVAAGASRGNAGWIAPSLVALHEPAALRYGLRSLTRPAGVRRNSPVPDREWWGFLAQVTANRRWSSWTRAVRRNQPLTDECIDAFQVLTTNGVDARTVEAPVVAAFRTVQQAEGLLGVLDRLEEIGHPVERSGLFGQALRAEMPLASPALAVGVRIEGQRYADPEDFTHALARSVLARGGDIRTEEVVDVHARRGGVEVRTDGGPALRADVAVIATGASVARLARRCGVPVPARMSRGYSFTVAVDRPVPGPIYLPEARAMCTPHRDGMRVAGMAESLVPEGEDVRSLIASARPLLEGVRWSERGNLWVGDGPVTPDGRPLIGATPVAGVYLAGGHDRWGFTHGPVTGRLLAEQITTGTRPEALRAFALVNSRE
ncbi:FAD-dependent oxidoreductase [Amycolatopsis sp. NPDC049691]|uniref:NAD(P)/FAD-dependent oxidoreductase n=1 Tax=Amycolatopsis sp. NPDC049691 TaxID=3155155 RepID=UPI0034318577